MAVGLKPLQALAPVAGVKLATTASGSRYQGRDDVLLMTIAEGSSVAGVFTKNRYCAAPVTLAKENLRVDSPRAFLINAGNANAGTGLEGMHNAQICCAEVAAQLGLAKQQILPFSTGVIGEQLAVDKILASIKPLIAGLADGHWLAAASSIMTTDTLAKGASEQVTINGQAITITGITKGSGMICPNMATMLAYVATDAGIDDEVLQSLLERACDASFNRITVDGDTSTNDALMLIATGHSSLHTISDRDCAEAEQFYSALERVLISLATDIIRDGEGATKFVKVHVVNAFLEKDAESIAYSIAHSPLVKTALYASDPNWGRILAAIGKAEVEQLDLNKVDIQINDLALIVQGEPAASYTEEQGKQEFEKDEISIVINLNLGAEQYHVWTTDLSHDYVTINADYRS